MDRKYLSNSPGSRAATQLGRGMTVALKACSSKGETEKMGLAPCPVQNYQMKRGDEPSNYGGGGYKCWNR